MEDKLTIQEKDNAIKVLLQSDNKNDLIYLIDMIGLGSLMGFLFEELNNSITYEYERKPLRSWTKWETISKDNFESDKDSSYLYRKITCMKTNNIYIRLSNIIRYSKGLGRKSGNRFGIITAYSHSYRTGVNPKSYQSKLTGLIRLIISKTQIPKLT